MGLKILIVDDSPVSRKIVRKCLPSDQDLEIFEAVDGWDAVVQFKKIKPDVTLLDLTMPVMDGFEALAEIKTIDKKAPVAVLTADIQPKTYERVMELGALMIVAKPVSAEVLKEVLKKATKPSKE